jgi:hypothetical protein
MTDLEKAQKVAAFLKSNRSDFMNDPNDDSFWVHRRIIISIQNAYQRRGKSCKRPFDVLKDEFCMQVMMLQPGGQFEHFPHHLPAIERIVFIKGDDLCIAGIHPIFAWEEEVGA